MPWAKNGHKPARDNSWAPSLSPLCALYSQPRLVPRARPMTDAAFSVRGAPDPVGRVQPAKLRSSQRGPLHFIELLSLCLCLHPMETTISDSSGFCQPVQFFHIHLRRAGVHPMLDHHPTMCLPQFQLVQRRGMNRRPASIRSLGDESWLRPAPPHRAIFMSVTITPAAWPSDRATSN